MTNIKVRIEGIAPLSFSKKVSVEKLNKEHPADYEKRTWREKMHYDNTNNEVFIPGVMFKNALAGAAKYLSMQIPGKGKSTYTKNFEAGLMCFAPVKLGIDKDDVANEWLFVPSDGKRGGTTRVDKCFPIIHKWSGVVEFIIVDSIITREVFERHLSEAGSLIGIGRYRPRNNGYYGRFTYDSDSLIWSSND